MKFAIASLLALIILWPPAHADSRINNSIISSLKCQPEDAKKILLAFRSLKEKKEELAAAGIVFSITDKGTMDERIKISFKEPLELLGAQANHAEMYIDGGDFIVSADFEGDAEKVIHGLDL